MLKIIYGDTDTDSGRYIFDPDTFFNHQYKVEWFKDARVVEMIKDIDKSHVIKDRLIDSPVLGMISPERLSGGVKTLILIDKIDSYIFNASACGDNCAKWLLDIGKGKDITVRLGYLMDFGGEDFEIKIMNTGKIVHTLKELDDEVIDNNLLD